MIPAANFLNNPVPIAIPVKITSYGPEETINLGKRLALNLEIGSVVALSGPLGAGKTCLVKGIALGLGVEEEVASPTYTIVSEYEGFPGTGNACKEKMPVPVYHIDAYRLKGDNDFSAMGGEEIIFGKGISIIEWCENIRGFIPKEALIVDIMITGDNERLISFNKANQ